MVDILYTGTKAGETIIGGMVGGLVYSIISEGVVGIGDISSIVGVFFVLTFLFFALHWWYERKRGEPFR